MKWMDSTVPWMAEGAQHSPFLNPCTCKKPICCERYPPQNTELSSANKKEPSMLEKVLQQAEKWETGVIADFG
jgi:hypothetical protein